MRTEEKKEKKKSGEDGNEAHEKFSLSRPNVEMESE